VITFVPVIKRFALCGILFLAIAFLLTACATSDETISDPSTSQSAASVPGEKIPDNGSFTPGPPGSSGSIHW
jgi:starvation-inducible outer membrane lipoprotein